VDAKCAGLRGGFGSGGLGIGQNLCSSVENKFTNNPSVDRFGRSGLLSGFGGQVVGFKEYASGLFWIFLGL
jgi:hypothetical protein